MGTAKMQVHDFSGALPDFQRAIALDPKLPEAHSYYGEALLGAGDPVNAAAAFRQEIEISPIDFKANLKLGVLAKQEHDYEGARRYLDQALRSRPGDPGVRYQLATLDLAAGKIEQARVELEALVKESPQFTEAHASLATVYYRLKRKQDGDRERAIVERLGSGKLTRRCFLTAAGAALAAPSALFEEIPSSASGITWVHDNAMSDNRYLPETLGPGCAFLDYDNDGWMDIYLVNSGPCDFFQPKRPLRNALYRNNRDGTFTDVTENAGVAGGTFGMGVAAGDYNNDGFPDLFVTAYGRSILYRNNGDGTFTDVTGKAGLPLSGWTTSAVWFDYDNDSKLDLFVCSFVDYGKTGHFDCGANKLGRRFYCVPRLFKPTASFLFHNNGDGSFTETGHGTDIGKALGKGLGVVATDINNDGRMDLFVANDTVQNFLFVNRGAGKWEEMALATEVAFSENGQPRSGMGVDAADLSGDGRQDLFVANIDQEMFSLYRNNGNETFTDVAHTHTVAQATRLLSGWGLKFFDYDNDGATDLILASGHPDDMIETYSPQIKYKEPPLLFHQENGKLRNVSAEAGPAFSRMFAARGLAVGDFNNDGRLDVLIGNNGGAPLLLRNNAGHGNHGIGLKLAGKTCNRDAIGARISWSAGGVTRSRLKTSGGSYLSSHDPREVLGLGAAARADWVEIRWPAPSRRVERLTDLPVDRYTSVRER